MISYCDKVVMKIIAMAALIHLVTCTGNQDPTSNLNGYVSLQDDRWQSTTIEVCYEQDGFTVDKENLSSYLTTEFEKADIFFTGWQKCEADSRGLRVIFTNNGSGSKVNAFGNRLDGLEGGISLDLGHNCSVLFSGSNCQRNMAVHEFGHAIGLHHEMNRRDEKVCHEHNQLSGFGENDAIQIGDYDPSSIMNYCNVFEANSTNRLLGLSSGDIATIQARYTKPTAFLKAHLDLYNLNQISDQEVGGYDVVRYRFKVGAEDVINCGSEQGYSADNGTGQPISSSVLNDFPLKTRVRICLLGVNSSGVSQPISQYTSIDYELISPLTVTISGVTEADLQTLSVSRDFLPRVHIAPAGSKLHTLEIYSNDFNRKIIGLADPISPSATPSTTDLSNYNIQFWGRVDQVSGAELYVESYNSTTNESLVIPVIGATVSQAPLRADAP